MHLIKKIQMIFVANLIYIRKPRNGITFALTITTFLFL